LSDCLQRSCFRHLTTSVCPISQGTKRPPSSRTRRAKDADSAVRAAGNGAGDGQVLDWLVEQASDDAQCSAAQCSVGQSARSSPLSFQDCASNALNSGSEEEEFRTASEGTQGSGEEDFRPMSVSVPLLAMMPNLSVGLFP
jgi:hypothetical protein